MNKSLENWRKQIDKLDEEILYLLAKRMTIVSKIGKYKKMNGIPPFDETRWQEMLQSRMSHSDLLNISKEFIKKLFETIHKYSLKIEGNK